MARRIFVASPLGFAESTRGFRASIEVALAENGYEAVDPWSLSADLEAQLESAGALPDRKARKRTLHRICMEIAGRNHNALASSDGVLAVLDGVDVDPGTASEIGFTYASGGKTIHGYRGDFRRLGENEGVSVNLQVQYWIERSGGRIVTSIDDIKRLSFEAGETETA